MLGDPLAERYLKGEEIARVHQQVPPKYRAPRRSGCRQSRALVCKPHNIDIAATDKPRSRGDHVLVPPLARDHYVRTPLEITQELPVRVVVMKVGVHLGEPWETIVERKLAEERSVGVAYWGYGGSVCHPITQVQPFAGQGSPVTVLMVRTPSNFYGSPTPAIAASSNGRSWEPIPQGVSTSGRYALVLRSLRETHEELDLGAYEVAIGPKEGSPLASYLRGRVDKACARSAPTLRDAGRLRVVMRAELVPPYAVVLKTP